MMPRVRVLHVIQNLNYGGMERLLADIVQRLDRDRFESHVMALQYLGRFAEGLDRYAELHVAERMPRYSMLWPGPLIRQIRRIGPQVVHTHSGVWHKATLAARRAGVPLLIHTEHGRRRPDPWLDRLIDGMAARRTDVVVAVSDALARQLAATVVRDAGRIRVILNGVDTGRFRPRADSGVLRRDLDILPGAPIVGSIGRLEPIKGYDVMIAAFARLVADWSGNARPVLVVAGEGSGRADLMRRVESYGLGDLVRLPGWRDDVHDLHSAFAVFTLSSRSEGTSVSLLEAMSAGLCPVVTDVGGNRAVLGEALSHRLVASENPEALATAWRAALSDVERRRGDAVAARQRVEQAFGLPAMVRAYERLYLRC